MINFKQKKVDSIIQNLLFNVSLGTLILFPLGVKAITVIDDSNISNYTTSGIDTSSIRDEVIIKTTGNTRPHINSPSKGLEVYGGSITVNSTDPFVIQSNSANNNNRFYGVYAVSRGNFVSNSDLQINIEKPDTMNNDGYNYRGIFLASTANAVFNKSVSINGSGKNFVGIYAYNSSSDYPTKGEFNGEVSINTSGEGSVGILTVKSDNSTQLGSALTFNDKVTINTSGDNNKGIYFGTTAYDDSPGDTIEIKNGLDLTASNGTPILMTQKGGKLNISGGSNDVGIVSEDYKHYNAIEAHAGVVNIDGKANIKGDILAIYNRILNDKGIVYLNLIDGSRLLSTIDNRLPSDPQAKGDINLNLSGSQSQWKMTGNSVVDSLALSDDAKVSFGYNYDTPDSASHLDNNNKAMTLTADSLAGNGVFEMRTAIGTNLDSDMLKITGAQQATGNHRISINDQRTGAATVTGNEKIKLVETNGGNAEFSLFSSAIDIGGYEFNTLNGFENSNPGGKDWILSASPKSNNGGGSSDTGNGGSDSGDTGNGGSDTGSTDNGGSSSGSNNNGGETSGGSGTKPDSRPNLTNTAKNAANILNSNYLMNYVETQTLLQRMGQLRTDDTASGKVWGRIYTGKLSSFNDKRLSGFDMDYYGLQLGLDRKLNSDKVNFYYGLMGGLSRGNVDHNVGDGSTNSYSLGLYGTLQSQNGFYLDGLVKYMHMTNKFNSMTAGGYHVKGDGNTNGFSIGAEVGKRIHLSSEGNPDEGWYVEPQAQLTYSHQDGATINASNGLSTRLGSYDSLIGRASLIVGYTIQSGKNPVDIYLKTGYLREFKGETSYTFNQVAKEKYDFGGNWWDNGIGVNMRLNRKHNLYGDVVYSAGNKFDRKQVNIGYRYNF